MSRALSIFVCLAVFASACGGNDSGGGKGGTGGATGGSGGVTTGGSGGTTTGGAAGSDAGVDAAPDSGADAAKCQVVGVSAGSVHTCAWSADGASWCWGDNKSGELGRGSSGPWQPPGPMKGNMSFALLSAGTNYTCGVKADAALWCWGDSTYGKLGGGTADINCGCSASPSLVGSLGYQVTKVDTGNGHTCALEKDGSVVCFGWNVNGQLGSGTTKDAAAPVQVAGLVAKDIVVGDEHSCAIATDGKAWCWGSNDACQIGIGPPQNVGCFGNGCVPSATVLASLGNVDSVAAGGQHTCAVKPDGTLWCWGNTASGQVGDGTTTGNSSWSPACKDVPVQVSSLGANVKQVSAGKSHTCALKKDGSVWCWGSNDKGQLGATATSTCGFSGTPCEPAPIQVPGVSGAVALSAGGDHTCIIDAGAKLFCWGANASGEVGDGTAVSPVTAPTVVAGLCP